jgi:hypothetical protein
MMVTTYDYTASQPRRPEFMISAVTEAPNLIAVTRIIVDYRITFLEHRRLSYFCAKGYGGSAAKKVYVLRAVQSVFPSRTSPRATGLELLSQIKTCHHV